MSRMRYAIACAALLGALLINLVALHVRTSAQGPGNRAGLVIQYKDGRVLTRCVSFSEPEISGYDLLRRARLRVIADVSSGASICKIDDTGCNFPAQQCFCECQDLNQTCIYWTYFFQANGAWKYSSLGAAVQKVANGGVNGWLYGVGNESSSSITPPLVSFEQICGAEAPTSAPATAVEQTVAPTPAPTLAPSATVPRPTITPVPATPRPTSGPTAKTLAAATATQQPVASATTTTEPAPAPSATPLPTATPTARVTASPVPTTPAPPAMPESAAQSGSSATGYLVFGGIAAGLAVVLLLTRRTARNHP